ncbi:dihydrolipoyl dehydrogenase [Anaeramoeba ignava]|uniref:Dihydrolipoyl dehydrogenase n=1 Tax=Anaeramoeba ignava TaxID=1746090 RepID=A0A9Q0LL54_ANAIG|nr:dihydrolipoyl dehydrogenase [Anaeramoeba ignava]
MISLSKSAYKFPSFDFLRSLTTKTKDLVVIGGGPGGYVAAIKAAQLGMNVLCAEKRGALGGTCLQEGCIPSKTLLHTSHLFEESKKEFPKLGILVDNPRINIQKIMQEKNKVVSGLSKGIEMLFKKNKVEYLKGKASITKPGQVLIEKNETNEKEIIDAKNILIATGSDFIDFPWLKIDEKVVLSSRGALSLNRIPKKMIIIGGGVIGLELRVENNTAKLKVLPIKEKDSKVIDIEADSVLVSVGRKPVTEGLGLEKLGIKMNKRQVEINEKFETNIPGIYAIGDIVRGPMLAHKAEEEGIAAVSIMNGGNSHINYDIIPEVIYTTPEVAKIGKTEEQLKSSGIKYRKSKFPYIANSRARAMSQTDGFVKFLTDQDHKLLGAHVIGPNASEAITECSVAMQYGLTVKQLSHVCHPHPTLSEAILETAFAAYFKPIHF